MSERIIINVLNITIPITQVAIDVVAKCTQAHQTHVVAILRSLHYYYCTTLQFVLVDRDLVVGICLQELKEGIELTLLIVLDRVGLVVAREEVDGGETTNGNTSVNDLVGGRVHLGNDNILSLSLHLLGKLLPGRGCNEKCS